LGAESDGYWSRGFEIQNYEIDGVPTAKPRTQLHADAGSRGHRGAGLDLSRLLYGRLNSSMALFNLKQDNLAVWQAQFPGSNV
jgi:outer membrane receptor for ferric coprogen and ferric-rhodotorulic acid